MSAFSGTKELARISHHIATRPGKTWCDKAWPLRNDDLIVRSAITTAIAIKFAYEPPIWVDVSENQKRWKARFPGRRSI